jgi:hypothetical protein
MIAAHWNREVAYEGCIARLERDAFLHRTAYFRFGELRSTATRRLADSFQIHFRKSELLARFYRNQSTQTSHGPGEGALAACSDIGAICASDAPPTYEPRSADCQIRPITF